MKLLRTLDWIPREASTFIRLNIDWVCLFYFFIWIVISISYFFFYDKFYYPNALLIEHYCNFSFAGWLFMFGHYAEMRPWGKVTVIGFTGTLLINSYQIHFNFDEPMYFVMWTGILFGFIFLAYAYLISKGVSEIINPKYK